jgi:hypothetical protein
MTPHLRRPAWMLELRLALRASVAKLHPLKKALRPPSKPSNSAAPKYHKICEWCEDPFLAASSGARRCLRCRSARQGLFSPVRACDSCGAIYSAARHKGYRFCKPSCARLVPKNCAYCGSPFTAQQQALYCSNACKRRKRHGHPPSAVHSGPRIVIDRAAVAKKSLECHLCGELLDSSRMYPHRWSTTVDHVIPVMRGGSDVLDNLMPAHLICNWLKWDREQFSRESLRGDPEWMASARRYIQHRKSDEPPEWVTTDFDFKGEDHGHVEDDSRAPAGAGAG